VTNSAHDVPPRDPTEVDTTNQIARHLAGELVGQPPADIWRFLAATFAGTPLLAAEITELRAQLAGVRLDRANLAAAALAAIAAYQDDEPDPLAYLRDELRAQGYDPDRSRR
jgi:hypothetical protein